MKLRVRLPPAGGPAPVLVVLDQHHRALLHCLVKSQSLVIEFLHHQIGEILDRRAHQEIEANPAGASPGENLEQSGQNPPARKRKVCKTQIAR